MDVLREHQRARQHYYDQIRNELGTSEKKAVGDILHILENLNPSIAGAVSLLHICEHILYQSTPVVWTNPSGE